MLLVDDLAAGGTKNLRHTPRGLVTLFIIECITVIKCMTSLASYWQLCVFKQRYVLHFGCALLVSVFVCGLVSFF